MGWVEELHGKTVGLDTAPLIFFIEGHPIFADLIRPFFQSVDRGEVHVVTSVVTLIEVLVHPLRHGNESLAHEYNDILLSSANISTMPVTPAIAQAAAELRAEQKLKTPDAIQIATALTHRSTHFLTNDRDFGVLQGLEMIRLIDMEA